MNPPSTARTAGRSDQAERRFRRQPFILLSFSSSKKPRKAQETQSYQRFQHIGRTAFNTFDTNAATLVSRGLAGTHATPAPNCAHNGSQGETGGVLDGGGITTLGAFRTFTNLPGPGVRTANFAAFGSWPGGLPKNAESLRDSDALMRVAVPRRRGPAGLRDLFRFCQNCGFHALRSGPFRVCEAGVVSLPSARFACC